MNDNAASIISKVWSFCNTLRDDGVGYGAYWGRKQAAKKESNRVRWEADKDESKPVADSDGKSEE